MVLILRGIKEGGEGEVESWLDEEKEHLVWGGVMMAATIRIIKGSCWLSCSID